MILVALEQNGARLRRKFAEQAASLTEPKVLFSQRIELNEGAAEGYGFSLAHPAEIDVSVSAMPKPVNVMLMSEDQWRAYQEVKGRIFGGKYWFKQSLSQIHTLKWDGHDDLPPGQYRIVVERPHEAILFQHPTVADVKITAM